MTRSRPTASRSAIRSGTSCIVEQLGLAMMPSWAAASSSLTPTTTSGTPGSMRHCEELSTTRQPRLAASGARSLETEPPALKSAMSTPWNASGVATSTGHSLPPNVIVRPSAFEARGMRVPTGKPRCSSTAIIVRPTRPVAPTTATVRGREGASEDEAAEEVRADISAG